MNPIAPRKPNAPGESDPSLHFLIKKWRLKGPLFLHFRLHIELIWLSLKGFSDYWAEFRKISSFFVLADENLNLKSQESLVLKRPLKQFARKFLLVEKYRL